MGFNMKRLTRGTLATLMAGAMLTSSLTAPAAFAGGGQGTGSGTGGTAGVEVTWAYKDDASGSWGSASDVNSVQKALTAAGVTLTASGRPNAQSAMDAARTECETGFDRRHPDEKGHADCRVVAVGAVATNGTTYDGTGYNDYVSDWHDVWNTYVAPYPYFYSGSERYYTSTPFTDDQNSSVDKLMETATANPNHLSIVVIVLDKYQPAPPNYTLTGSTQATKGVTVAGQTTTVHDRLTLSRGGSSISETVNGKVTLHWRGVDGSTKEAKKDFTAVNGLR